MPGQVSKMPRLAKQLKVSRRRVDAPTFPPHPHAGFSAVTYLFLDSETGIANRDSLGNSTLPLHPTRRLPAMPDMLYGAG